MRRSRNWFTISAVTLAVGACGIVATPLVAQATTVLRATYVVPTQLMSSLPIARLTFNGPITASQLPTLSTTPKLNTYWEQIGPDAVQAVSTTKLQPLRKYTLKIPTTLSCSSTCTTIKVTSQQATVAYSVTLEEQMLADLHYLPVSFTPAPATSTTSNTTLSTATAALAGTFTWRFPAIASDLEPLWSVGSNNVILQGALKNFQSVHQLDATGVPDATTWQTLQKAVAATQYDPKSYNYVYVSQTQPETLRLYQNGTLIFSTDVNTGISQAPTTPGTFPVYLRYVTTTMSGTEPDGKPYKDPGIPWVSYFNGGDALHGFIRSSYGFPQSLGCVEMPFNVAAFVWKFTPIGTLVTVS